MDKLEKKFTEPRLVTSEDELQQPWKELESRVSNRRTYTREQRGSKVGRRNVRKTDEDVWLEANLYEDDKEDDKV